MAQLHVPYRVCLLGEHVDHQGGTTLSANLEFGLRLNYEPAHDGVCRVTSDVFEGEAQVDIFGRLERTGHWSDYLKGIVSVVRTTCSLGLGFRGSIKTEFPGGGVSSSAAVQVAFLAALLAVNNRRCTKRQAADWVVEAERGFVGIQVGYLDPLTILESPADSLLAINHFDLSTTHIRSCASPPRLLIISSGVKRQLADSPYNTRIAECRSAAAKLRPGATRLGDVPTEPGEDIELLPAERRRMRHFFSEGDRVRRGISAFRSGEWRTFGSLIDACGDSCVENFEVGVQAVNDLCSRLRSQPEIHGARFTGGGFGGAVLAFWASDSDPSSAMAKIILAYGRSHPEAAAQAQWRESRFAGPFQWPWD